MPELPEVETVKNHLWNHIKNKKIANVEVGEKQLRFPLPDNFTHILKESIFTKAHRHGKYMILQTDKDYNLLVHLGMTGRFIIGDETGFDAYHKDKIVPAHHHVKFHLECGKIISYYDPRRFGFMDLFPIGLETQNRFLKILGEDGLCAEFYELRFFEKLQKIKMPIKNALLNQSLVAGIGNIYASEALWKSFIHPLRLANSLSLTESQILGKHIIETLEASIIAGGSTLKDYRTPDGDKGSFQNQFHVYDQEGKLCEHQDGGIIEKIVMAGRSTYFCRECQK